MHANILIHADARLEIICGVIGKGLNIAEIFSFIFYSLFPMSAKILECIYTGGGKSDFKIIVALDQFY